MAKYGKHILFFLLLAVFLVSTTLLLRQFADNAAGARTYDSARELVRQTPSAPVLSPMSEPTLKEGSDEPEIPMKTVWIPVPVEDDPHLDTLAANDLTALRETNADVLGWILIPDSPVDFPLLQGEDNDYYLTHTWDHQYNSVGSIFLEHRNTPDFTDYNTIVYGHNMNDGAMFSELKDFSDEMYFQSHPYIYIALESGVYRYAVFSCYRAGLQDPTYGLSFNQETTKEKFLAHALGQSVIDTGIVPSQTDRILTLSTCFGDGSNTRWVVHARLEMMAVEVPDA